MRVLHFAKTFSPLSETFIYDYVTELEKQGLDNHVLTFRRENEESRPFPNVDVVEGPGRWNLKRLTHRLFVGFNDRDPRTSAWPQIRERLGSAIRRVEPNVVHAHFGPAGILIAPLTEKLDIPLVVSLHGFDAFKLPSEPFWSKKYPLLFERADCITVVSNVMAEHVTQIGAPADKVAVVRVGKRMKDYPYSAPTSPVRQWFSVGRLVEKKGFKDCISAFRQLNNTFPDTTLDIIGDGPRRGALQREIKSAGLSESVRLLGERPHREVKRRMASADGFVLCSKNSTDGDREGVPTVLMEAQAMGLPVVSTNHSGIPEVIPSQNRRFLATEGDVDQIAERLHRLARATVEEIQSVSQQGRTKVEQEFNLSSEAETLAGIYSDLLLP
jgi:glycosyltransferase involved in cell wall biosynthesis